METISTASASTVAQAVAKARADIIAPLGKTTIAITPFQQDLFEIAFKGAEKVSKAMETQEQAMRRALLDHYGSTCPTYAQFRADRAALKILAAQKGLVDDQWVRKPYNAAIHQLYGALPVSDSPAAQAKAAQRAAKSGGEGQDVAPKRGAVKGNTTERAEGERETIEQFIAKHGIAKVLAAASAILAERKETRLDATTLQAVARKYAVGAAVASSQLAA